MLATHTCNGVGHSPSVAVEHWQGVQVVVPIAHSCMPTERCCINPQGSMGLLDAFRAGCCARCVVNGRSCVFVWDPNFGLTT